MMSDAINEKKEEFRAIMGKFFYQIGEDEIYQDIMTESDDRLMLDAYSYAIRHFEEGLERNKEYYGT